MDEQNNQEGEEFYKQLNDLFTVVGYQKYFPYNPEYKVCDQTLCRVLSQLHERIEELEKQLHKKDE